MLFPIYHSKLIPQNCRILPPKTPDFLPCVVASSLWLDYSLPPQTPLTPVKRRQARSRGSMNKKDSKSYKPSKDSGRCRRGGNVPPAIRAVTAQPPSFQLRRAKSRRPCRIANVLTKHPVNITREICFKLLITNCLKWNCPPCAV